VPLPRARLAPLRPLLAALALLGWLVPTALAQDAATDPTGHPVSIDRGGCAQPSGEPAFRFDGTTVPWGLPESPGADAVAQPVLTTEQTVATRLDDLLLAGQPFSVVVHASPEAFGTPVACGDIEGSVAGGQLSIPLRPVGGFGLAGVALFDRDDQGFLGLGEQEVRVTVFLLTGLDAAAAPVMAGMATTPAPAASPSPAASPPAAAACPAGVAEPCLALTTRDLYFQPNLISIPADTPVTVVLTNEGEAIHNFSVTDHNNPGLPNLNISETVQPGQTTTFTLNAPAGTYYFFCNQPGHEQAGMIGYLDARAGAEVGGEEATVTPRAG